MKLTGYSPFLRVIETKLCFLILCVILIGAIVSWNSFGLAEVKGKWNYPFLFHLISTLDIGMEIDL